LARDRVGRWHRGGSLGGKRLETTVFGPETITVPAGTFACIRLDQREVWSDKTYARAPVWLARGIGTVKRMYVTGRVEVLTAFRLDDAFAKVIDRELKK